MKFGVIVFPGSNCDDDMVHIIGTVMGQPVEKIWHKEKTLNDFSSSDCIIVPGGFSYGDYLRSGAIARFSPIMESVIRHGENGGLIFGICNGFQILCEAGLLPGVLLKNTNQKYISRNVDLRVETNQRVLTQKTSVHSILTMPVAHGDGRYYCDPQTLESLKANDQILFRYSNPQGQVDDSTNINGSIENIAGICNKNGNIFGMMPHPERAAEDIVGIDDGLILFEGLINQVANPV